MNQAGYPKNQLDQVICQLRFPAQLSINRDVDRFQDAVCDSYPDYSAEQIVPIGVANPPGAGHIFTSADGQWFINVSTGALSLTTRKYEDWADFESRFLEVFKSFHGIFEVSTFNRIGLRYINAIRPQALGLGIEPKEIFREPVSQIFSPSTGTFNAGSIVLDRSLGDGISCRTSVGSIIFSDGQPGFAIDNDVFTVVPTADGDVAALLRKFNEISNVLFRETASDKLCGRVGL